MSMIKDIKRTANNIWHANENAKAREAAEKAAKRNAIIGGTGTVIACMAGIISRHHWCKKYLSLERRIDEYVSINETLELRISELENKVVNTTSKEDILRGEVIDD